MDRNGPRRRSRSRSPRPPRAPRGGDRQRSPPRGPRNHDRHIKQEDERSDRYDRRGGRSRSRSRSPPRGPRNDRGRDSVRQRSPPRGPRGPRRGSDDFGRPDTGMRDLRNGTGRPHRDPRDSKPPPIKKEPQMDIMDIDPEQDEDDKFRAQMRLAMGFGMFRSTKNTKVPGNDKLYAVRKEKKSEYRQYMNRQGGFNRPLSPTRG